MEEEEISLPPKGQDFAIRRQSDAERDRRMAALADRVGRDSRIRRIVQEILISDSISDPDVAYLIHLLAQPVIKPWRSPEVWRWILWSTRLSPEHTERELAAWALEQIDLPPDRAEQAATALRETLGENRKRDSAEQSVAVYRGQVRGLLLFVALGLVATTQLQLPPYPIGLFTLFFGAITALIYGGWILIPISLSQYKRHLIRVKLAAATALGRQVQPESVDELAYGVSARNPGLVRTCLQTLKTVLPTLTPNHYGRLAGETVPRLCQVLERPELLTFLGEEGVLCFLDALEKVGDGRAVEAVQAVAARPESSEALRARAEAVRRVLLERRRLEQDRSMLLRGSQSDAVRPDTLLRAARNGDATLPEEELLRPHLQEPEPQEIRTSRM